MNLIDAAKAVVARWDSPDWKDAKHTADHINALREAIEEAEKNQFNPDWNAINLLSEANFALHRRIAELEAEKVEPVAWMHKQGDFKEPALRQLSGEEIERGWEQYPLYTAPPQREWVGLTDAEIVKIVDDRTLFEGGYETWCDGTGVANSVTAALKEKNHIADAGKMVALEKENAELEKRLEQTAMALKEQVQLNKYLEKKKRG